MTKNVEQNVILKKLKYLPKYHEGFVLEPFIDVVGIKGIAATPCTREAWHWVNGNLDDLDDGSETAGYLVVYPDGYLSWSPKHTFEESYKQSGEMSYAMALHMVQTQAHLGAAMQRSGWNGKDQYVLEISGACLTSAIAQHYGNYEGDNNPECGNSLFIKTVDNKLFPWFASAGDNTAKDWSIIYLPLQPTIVADEDDDKPF